MQHGGEQEVATAMPPLGSLMLEMARARAVRHLPIISGAPPGVAELGGKREIDAEAARGVYAFDLDRQQDFAAFQRLDDARDGFEAQVGDVGNILPGRQDDLTGAVGE